MSRQEELETMSDFEVNCLVAAEIEPRGERTFKDYDLEEIRICYDRMLEDGSVNTDFDVVDYCNNPEDIMPIAIENNLSVTKIKYTDLWCCAVDDASICATNKNIYKAICIVFILMSESKS